LFPVGSIIVSAYYIPWLILGFWFTPAADSIQEQVDLAERFDLDGIVVHVDGTGFKGTYTAGWHDRAAKIPARPDALFKIASIGKMYVATAITKLVSDGTIDLAAPLSNYLPGVASHFKYGDELTVASMVMHKSGLPNYVDHRDYPWDAPPQSSLGHLQYAYDMEQEFRPMEDSAYSNTNYLLLTMLMDTVLGYSHHRFIEERVLRPLELDNTYLEMKQVDSDRVMSGYFVGYDPDIKDHYFGSMVATAEDVGRFVRAMHDGSLFTPEEAVLYDRIYVRSHTGLLPGYQSLVRYYPDLDAVLVQFTNTNGGYAWNIHTIMHNKIVRILRRYKE
jgi:CubicO group peptidase (beta-lactamase class C family)